MAKNYAQSIRNKTVNLCKMIIEHDTDVMFLTETWLKDDDQVVLETFAPMFFSV